jgi:hypothetical protein
MVLSGCVTPRVVTLQPQGPLASAESFHGLHVITTIDGAADPLPLNGDCLVFAGVASTLGKTIAGSARGWAERHSAQRPGGWEMRVSLIQSRADVSNGRITVELATTVTLSATLGQGYLAQTHGYCKQTDVLVSDPTRSVYTCMDVMAHDLAGWLEGVSP